MIGRLKSIHFVLNLSFPKYSPDEEGGKLLPGVVLLTGLMESMTKYGETIAHLNDRCDGSGTRIWWRCVARFLLYLLACVARQRLLLLVLFLPQPLIVLLFDHRSASKVSPA